jgi:replicative DNA helicase
MSESFEKSVVLPSDTAAEAGVISCILQEPAAVLPEMRQFLTDEHFYQPCYAIVWQAVCSMADAGTPIDVVTLDAHLRERGELEKMGGPAAISELFTFVPGPAQVQHYVKMLREKRLLRALAQECASTLERLHYGAGELEQPGVIVSEHEGRVFQLVEQAQSLSAAQSTARQVIDHPTMTDEWLQRMERAIASRGDGREDDRAGITTPWHDVNRNLGVLGVSEDGDLLMLGGKPGQGKSIAAISMLEHVAITRQTPTLVFPLEMGRSGYSDRLNLGRLGIDTGKARSGFFTRDEQGLLANLISKDEAFATAPIFWDHRAFITTAELRATIQVYVRRHGIKCVIIDHMGQIKPVGKEARKDERLGIKEIMETLHAIRHAFGIVIILCVQLTKDADKRGPSQLPMLSDMRGASEIEEYASQVIFVHRPCMYRPWSKMPDERQDEWARKTGMYRDGSPENWCNGTEYADFAAQDYAEHALFMIRKNRFGPTPDNLCIRFQAAYQRFTNRTPVMYSNNPKLQQVILPGFT